MSNIISNRELEELGEGLIRHYLEQGIRIGLATDVAGGTSESMFRAVTDAIQMSKMYWRHVDQEARPLTKSGFSPTALPR